MFFAFCFFLRFSLIFGLYQAISFNQHQLLHFPSNSFLIYRGFIKIFNSISFAQVTLLKSALSCAFYPNFCKGSVLFCQQKLSSLLTKLTYEFYVNSSIGIWSFSSNNPLCSLTPACEVMPVFQLLFSLATYIYLHKDLEGLVSN